MDIAKLDLEKHRSVSSEFIVKPEAVMSKMMEGVQTFDVEDDVLPQW